MAMRTIQILLSSLALLATTALADSQCIAWARLVEQMDALPPHERTLVYDEAAKLARPADVASRYLMSAVNWLRHGGTVRAAWQQCAGDAT